MNARAHRKNGIYAWDIRPCEVWLPDVVFFDEVVLWSESEARYARG